MFVQEDWEYEAQKDYMFLHENDEKIYKLEEKDINFVVIKTDNTYANQEVASIRSDFEKQLLSGSSVLDTPSQ